jgi:hypothetical protein
MSGDRDLIRAAMRKTVIFLAAATFAAGCTAGTQSKAMHPAGGASARSALTGAERRVHCGDQRQQASAPLPADFVADAAVLCDPAVVDVTHGGGHASSIKRVADRGLAPLAAALRQPSARPSSGTICAAQLVIVPLLFLIDGDGQIVRPVIPTDACGQPQQQVLDALQHVPWVGSSANS